MGPPMAKHRKGMCLRFPNGVIAKWPEEHAPPAIEHLLLFWTC